MRVKKILPLFQLSSRAERGKELVWFFQMVPCLGLGCDDATCLPFISSGKSSIVQAETTLALISYGFGDPVIICIQNRTMQIQHGSLGKPIIAYRCWFPLMRVYVVVVVVYGHLRSLARLCTNPVPEGHS